MPLYRTLLMTLVAGAVAGAPFSAASARDEYDGFTQHRDTHQGYGYGQRYGQRYGQGYGRGQGTYRDAGHRVGHRQGHRGHTQYAEVVRVEPLFTTVQVATPVQQCYDEPVRYRGGHGGGHRGGGRSYTGPIVGGIVGGLVGNQFGGGDGQTLLTVAGAVLGASIGNDHSYRGQRRHGRRQHGYTQIERRCTTTEQYHQEQRNDGYLVDYRYNGRVYTTRLDYHPGNRLAVDVQVLPRN